MTPAAGGLREGTHVLSQENDAEARNAADDHRDDSTGQIVVPGQRSPSAARLLEMTARDTDQWRSDARSGRLKEAFACGTAAVVASIGKIKSAAGDILIADGSTGPITAAIKAKLVGIQRGEIPDEFGWVRRIG